jgi:uncharacterized protein YqeY
MLYEKISAERTVAAKEQNAPLKRTLSLILGEVERFKGTKGFVGFTDELVVSTVLTMIKNNKKLQRSYAPEAPEKVELAHELAVMRQYLPEGTPEDLSPEEMLGILVSLKEKHQGNQALIMKEAKTFPGMDMKDAAEMYKTL